MKISSNRKLKRQRCVSNQKYKKFMDKEVFLAHIPSTPRIRQIMKANHVGQYDYETFDDYEMSESDWIKYGYK